MQETGDRVLRNVQYLLFRNNLNLKLMKRITLLIAVLFMFNISFSQDQLARARSDKGWSWIDNNGKYVINPQFPNAYPFVKLAW